MLFLVGLLVFELTSEASFGVGILSVKFGLEDFRTAFWLRRRDIKRTRARACFWLYVSSGLFKMAVTGVVMMFAIAGIVAANGGFAQPQQNRVPGSFGVAAVTAMWGFFACGLTGGWGLLWGLRGRQKVWLNSGLHAARRESLWPPPPECLGHDNSANWVAFVTLFLLAFAGGCLCLVGFLAVFFGKKQPVGLEEALIPIVSVAVVVGMAVAILLGHEIVGARLLAKHPGECWTTEDGTTDYGPRTTDQGS